MNPNDIKTTVKEKYDKIAQNSKLQIQSACCGTSSCCEEFGFSMIGDEYNNIEGHNPDADLGLGCGIPTEYAGIQTGHHVLDLGSGAGNDCFVARSIVGETGKVTGLDFSEEMLTKARSNAQKLGYTNVEFVAGDIDDMPLENNQFDVVISNCVLNLVPDKNKAFAEIMRVLKSGGHFSISDVVLNGQLPDKLKSAAEMYAGCVSGAMQLDEYLEVIKQVGFQNIEIHKQRSIEIPRNILENYLDEDELLALYKGNLGIFSVTVSAFKD